MERNTLSNLGREAFSAILRRLGSGMWTYMSTMVDDRMSRPSLVSRLERALSQLEITLEDVGKWPIIHVALLRRNTQLRAAYMDGMKLLSKHKQQPAAMEGSDVCEETSLSLNSKTVADFELYAADALDLEKKVREAYCPIRNNLARYRLINHLLEGKILGCQDIGADKNKAREFFIFPVRSGERGVEALLGYHYFNREDPHKSFRFALMLRLSESTNIAGTAMYCLKSLAAHFGFEAESVSQELGLFANFHDTSGLDECTSAFRAKYTSLWDEHMHSKQSRSFRPDPLCCTRQNSSAISSSFFPEQVIAFFMEFGSSALRHSSHLWPDERIKRNSRRPRLVLTVNVRPHFENKKVKESFALEKIGHTSWQRRDVSILRQVGKTIETNAMRHMLDGPGLIRYEISWVGKHGAASFCAQKF